MTDWEKFSAPLLQKKLTKAQRRAVDILKGGGQLLRPGIGEKTWIVSDLCGNEFRLRDAAVDRVMAELPELEQVGANSFGIPDDEI